MSWNGSGNFTRIFSWISDKAAGIDISSTRMDTDSNDIAANGFGNCLTRDGQGAAAANLPMNSFRHTGVGDGVARSDYASLGQSQDGKINWVAAGGTADALTATYSPAVTTLVDGQLFFVRVAAANATTTPTFAPNGLTAHTITKFGGIALAAGDILGNLAEVILRYNLANTRYELLNPANGPASSTANDLVTFADTSGQKFSDSSVKLTAVTQACVEGFFDGTGQAITTNIFLNVEVPFAGTITRWTLVSDQSTTSTVDVYKSNAALPTVANKITSSAPPSISAATYASSTTLTGWTTSVAARDVIQFIVTANNNAQRLTISLTITKSS